MTDDLGRLSRLVDAHHSIHVGAADWTLRKGVQVFERCRGAVGAQAEVAARLDGVRPRPTQANDAHLASLLDAAPGGTAHVECDVG